MSLQFRLGVAAWVNRILPFRSCWSCSAALRTPSLYWRWIARSVRTPTMTANEARITQVSAAEPPASRQRIGTDLYAENVARAADRVKEARLATGFQLAPEVGYEDFNRIGHRERVIAPHLVEQPLAGDHDPLVAHQVLEELELTLGEVDVAGTSGHLVGVGVELEVAHGERGLATGRTAAQQRP